MKFLFVTMATLMSVSSFTIPFKIEDDAAHPNPIKIFRADPFDTSNSTLCWKRRECIDVDVPSTDDILKSCHFSKCGKEFPIQCGLGCAVSKEECEKDLYQKVNSVAEVAFNIGQIFLASTQSPNGNPNPNALAPLGSWAKSAAEGLARSAMAHFLANSLGEHNAQALAKQIIARAFGDVQQKIDWTIADPTGVANVIKAFWKPLCPVG